MSVPCKIVFQLIAYSENALTCLASVTVASTLFKLVIEVKYSKLQDITRSKEEYNHNGVRDEDNNNNGDHDVNNEDGYGGSNEDLDDGGSDEGGGKGYSDRDFLMMVAIKMMMLFVMAKLLTIMLLTMYIAKK